MYIVKQTNYFSRWLSKLKDVKGKVSILRRVERMKYGNFGDYKSLKNNISELRITTGLGLESIIQKKMMKLLFY